MLFYFSGTGNSRHVAKRLARHFDERILAMDECLRRGEVSFALSGQERLGFVFPVYFWGLPSVVNDFVACLQLTGEQPSEVYDVLTYGTTIGAAHTYLRRLLRHKGLRLNRSFVVRMPDVWTPLFNLTDRERSLRRCQRAESYIDRIIACLETGQRAPRNFTALPRWLAAPYHATYGTSRRTAHFHLVPDRCISCCLCARQCPAGAIEMSEGHPVWTKTHCAACLRCLHSCPVFAIQYGRHTAKHGQYLYPEREMSRS